MAKSKRLIEIMMTINKKKSFNVKELADEFGVSTRTIMRDMQELSALGVPFYSEVGQHGGYKSLTRECSPLLLLRKAKRLLYFLPAMH